MFSKGNRHAAEREKLKFAVKEGDHLTLLNGLHCPFLLSRLAFVLTRVIAVFNAFQLNQKDPQW